MSEIVECVLNISEGRDARTLDAVAAAIARTSGSFLLHTTADPDHHRAVYSFIGDRSSVQAAAFAAAAETVSRVDLRIHRGEHPRLGAVDVIPFIPIQGITMDECVVIARGLGQQLGDQLELPVFLYANAASTPSRRHLAWIRKKIGRHKPGDVLAEPDQQPDFGPGRLHPTAGATTVGARSPLIAFNIFLETDDTGVAQRIAARVREVGGGLPGLRALGFFLASRGQAQVSMNVTEPDLVSLRDIFQRVVQEAHLLGTSVTGSEIIGLISRRWLPPEDVPELRLEGFEARQIMENSIENAHRDRE